jgi:hypothetical protein
MLTTMQAEAGLLVNGGGGGGGGVTEAWVEEHFVPLTPLFEDPTIHPSITNNTDHITLECKNEKSYNSSSVTINDSVTLSSIQSGNAAVLRVAPEMIEYIKTVAGATTGSEIATKADLKAITSIVLENATITNRLSLPNTNGTSPDLIFSADGYQFRLYRSSTELRLAYESGSKNITICTIGVGTDNIVSDIIGDVSVGGQVKASNIRLNSVGQRLQFPCLSDRYEYLVKDNDFYVDYYITSSQKVSVYRINDLGGSFDMIFNGDIHAHNLENMTVTHMTEVYDPHIGRFCETTNELFDYDRPINVTDCICKVKLSTVLSNKILGIITKDNQLTASSSESPIPKDEVRSSPCGSFASHGDVLVIVDDGEYHIGDLLVPTLTGSRVATDEDKLFMMLNGLPRVRITCINGNYLPKINNRACVACFIS